MSQSDRSPRKVVIGTCMYAMYGGRNPYPGLEQRLEELADLIDGMGEGEQQLAISQRGMTTRRAKIAGTILGMQVDLQAINNALGGGAISPAEHRNATNAIKRNYSTLIAEAVAGRNGKTTEDEG